MGGSKNISSVKLHQIKNTFLTTLIGLVLLYCYTFLDQLDNSLPTSVQVESYLNHLSKTREDWQVKQAEVALRHYGYYLASELKTPEDPGPPSETKELSGEQLRSFNQVGYRRLLPNP